MRQLTTDATTMFSRARQFTEEKLGSAERTEYDANFENLQQRYENTKMWTEKLKAATESVLQPNPNHRVEDFLFSTVNRNPPNRINNCEQLGLTMIDAGKDLGPGTAYGNVLMKVGETQMKLGQAEQTFLQTTVQNYLHPLNNFLEGDCKTILREKKTLEKKRLDLDACKNKVKKAKTLDARQETEAEVRISQSEFNRQQDITKLLLEGVSSTQAQHSRNLNEFVDAQLEYYAKCYQYMKDLQESMKTSEPSPSFHRSQPPSARASVQINNITSNKYTSGKQARVLYDYDAADTTELSLLADEIILVYETPSPDSDWVIGERGSTRGKVPASYISIMN